MIPLLSALIFVTASPAIDVEAEVDRAVDDAIAAAGKTKRGLVGQLTFALDGDFGKEQRADGTLTAEQRKFVQVAADPVKAAQAEILGSTLTKLGYVVLEEGSVLDQLRENGVSDEAISKSQEAADFREWARELQLEVFLWGAVTWLGGTRGYEARLSANRTSDNLAVFQYTKTAADGPSLRQLLEKDAPALLRKMAMKLVPELQRVADEARRRAEAELARRREELRKKQEAERYSLPDANPILDLGGHLVLRGGYGAVVGILGGGLELAFGPVAIGVGFGSHLTAGVTLYPLGSPVESGGLYLCAQYAQAGAGPDRTEWGYGGTVGWDWRPVRWVSVKLGVGGAKTNLAVFAKTPQVLLFDAAAGLVF